MHYNPNEWSINSSTCSERWHAEIYAQKLHTSVIEYHNSLIYLSFNLLARIKHLKLLQAVMLSDSLQRACGSYNHQGLTFQTSSFKKVWSVSICSYLLCIWSPSLLPEPPQGHLLPGKTGNDPQCYKHATCFDRSWGYTTLVLLDHSSSFCHRL